MGPTNIALVKLFQADTALRQANERYESAAKSVRIQERRLNDLTEKLKLAQTQFKELQARAGAFDLDIRSRNDHIEKLRVQQQNAKNNKEYQAFLTEINTGKIDKGKVEEEVFKVMEQLEKVAGEVKDLTAQSEEARKAHASTKEQLAGKLAELQKEIDELKPIRAAAAAEVPPRALAEFERLCERNDGEAMAPIAKPDRRHEEYICTNCNMSLVVDVYNRLHSRDEVIKCPSCQCLLYIPDDLPPEMAVHKGGVKPSAKAAAAPGEKKKRAPGPRAKAAKPAPPAGDGSAGGATVAPRKPAVPKSPWADLLRRAHGESVKNAIDASAPPVECEVFIDEQPQGTHKGKSAENLEQVIRFHLKEAGKTATVRVVEKPAEKPRPEAAPPVAPAPALAEAKEASPSSPPVPISTEAPAAPAAAAARSQAGEPAPAPAPPAVPPAPESHPAAPSHDGTAAPAVVTSGHAAAPAEDESAVPAGESQGVPEDVSSNA